MISVYIYTVAAAATVLACGYAWLRGGRVEKSVAATLFFATFFASVILKVAEGAHSSGLSLAMDALFGLYFLHLAMRYPKGWLIGEMLLMAVQFGFQSGLEIGMISRLQYAVGNNLVTLGTLVLLVYGTYQASKLGPASDSATPTTAPV
ncbi:MAG: hypothetical protein B7Z12_21225 [Caulobacter vibrioides]|uniref:Uncharacterized protein n=1 Tax=Caulobacter vibrioides TaxID=155892 RepID=A0A258CQG3_CAUVI|nr:MAG: hypothetical protein B7Z12_21225 [Caulobacter vibrioides]